MLALAALALAGCTPSGPVASDGPALYRGVSTVLLDADLVQVNVDMTGAETEADVADYAECAAAQYTLNRGYGFARHLRTKVTEKAGLWQGDAVYTISPSLPPGIKTIDAEVVAAACVERGIPTV